MCRVIQRAGMMTPTIDMHVELGLEYLSTRRDHHVSTTVYKGLNDLSTPFINELFHPVHERNEDGQGRVTRAQTNNELSVPQSLRESGEKRLSVRGSQSWNGTPAIATNSPSLNSYKRNVKKTGPVYIMINT